MHIHLDKKEFNPIYFILASNLKVFGSCDQTHAISDFNATYV